MITIIKGSIFSAKTQTVVNTVNCVGVMGKGIALIFRLLYPDMFDKYKKMCEENMLSIGKLWLYKGNGTHPWILNFPTKINWRYASRYDFIEMGLQKFVRTYKEKGITSIAFPILGTLNGRLDKTIVLDMMTKYLSKCDIPIEIYDYDSKAGDSAYEQFKENWKAIPKNNRKSSSGLKKDVQVEAVESAIADPKIRTLFDFVKKVGISTIAIGTCLRNILNR